MTHKLDTVRRYVANMHQMIQRAQTDQLKNAQQQQKMRQAQPEHDLPTILMDVEVTKSESVKSDKSEMKRNASPRKPMPSKPGMATTMSSSSLAAPTSHARAMSPRSEVAQAAAPPKPAESAPKLAEPAPKPAEPAKPAEVPKPADKKDQPREKEVVAAQPVGETIDYTKIPGLMEKKFEELDVDSALRPTIITAGTAWVKKYQKALLSAPESVGLGTTEQGKERTKTFDLLDALTKSGAISVDCASLHVVIAATHCFDKSLLNTVIQDNVNPIEKVERSSLIVASTIHGVRPMAARSATSRSSASVSTRLCSLTELSLLALLRCRLLSRSDSLRVYCEEDIYFFLVPSHKSRNSETSRHAWSRHRSQLLHLPITLLLWWCCLALSSLACLR